MRGILEEKIEREERYIGEENREKERYIVGENRKRREVSRMRKLCEKRGVLEKKSIL